MTATGSGTGRVRASDAEREQMAHILRAAMTEGRLDLAEGEQRLAAAYAATFRDELGPLAADLPDGGRRALAETPEAKAFARRLLRRHVGGVVVIAAILVGLWALSGSSFFWPVIPLAILAFSVAKHARWHHHYAHGHYAHGHYAHRGWRGPPWR